MFKRSGSFNSNNYNTVNIKCCIELPSCKQELLNKHFGHTRFVYNYCINYNKELYEKEKKSLSYVELQNLLPQLKKEEKTSFLKEVDSTCLQQAVQDYSTAFKNFVQRKGGYPSFRSKHKDQTCRIVNTSNRIRLSDDGKRIKLGKFDWVRIKPNQQIPSGTIQSVTIKRTRAGELYTILTIRRGDTIQQLPKTGKEVGIDIGMLNFATYSDGTVIARPDFVKADENRKKKMQRKLAKMKRGGKNYRKMKAKYAKFCQKDRNRREDFAHKLALDIVRNYDFIAVEKLDIKGMLTSDGNTFAIKKIHQMISELGWGSFLSKLEYKAQWYGKELVKVDTYFPSSQLCSSCGYQNSDVKNLSVRSWTCPTCGAHHDRDFNAATNILYKGKEMAVA